jgi:hypothetical protein
MNLGVKFPTHELLETHSKHSREPQGGNVHINNDKY